MIRVVIPDPGSRIPDLDFCFLSRIPCPLEANSSPKRAFHYQDIQKIPFGLPEFEFIDLFDSGPGLLLSVKGSGFRIQNTGSITQQRSKVVYCSS